MWKDHTILLVDDEPYILDQLELELKLNDFSSVIVAHGCKEAKEILKTSPVALVVADQMMPGG